MKVVHKGLVVEAQQYKTRGKLPQNVALAGTHGTGVYLMTKPPKLLKNGDWVTRDSFGTFDAYSDKDFKALFAEVKDA